MFTTSIEALGYLIVCLSPPPPPPLLFGNTKLTGLQQK